MAKGGGAARVDTQPPTAHVADCQKHIYTYKKKNVSCFLPVPSILVQIMAVPAQFGGFQPVQTPKA